MGYHEKKKRRRKRKPPQGKKGDKSGRRSKATTDPQIVVERQRGLSKTTLKKAYVSIPGLLHPSHGDKEDQKRTK